MASDDNETRLPEHVEKALAEARADASRRRAPGGTSGGRWLALVPVSIACVMLALMMPRSAPADDVPLPHVDRRALDAIRRDDVARAQAAQTKRLPDAVLAVGSAIRGYQKMQAHPGPIDAQLDAKRTLDDALRQLYVDFGSTEASVEQLRSLRAVQLDQFLAEVAAYERTGAVSADLEELAGSFVDHMKAAGWLDGHRVLLDDAQRRAAFKAAWTILVAGSTPPAALAVTIDEQRALYTLYLEHPHPQESQRTSLSLRRAGANAPDECARVNHDERVASELWRADKIKRLGDLDPSYPTGYALGVAYYRAGRFDQSAEAFQKWLDAHPDGPWTLRARNHMKAALVAYGP